jgi:hypothetical protein
LMYRIACTNCPIYIGAYRTSIIDWHCTTAEKLSGPRVMSNPLPKTCPRSIRVVHTNSILSKASEDTIQRRVESLARFARTNPSRRERCHSSHDSTLHYTGQLVDSTLGADHFNS